MTIFASTLLFASEQELQRRLPSGVDLICGSACADDAERRLRFLEAEVAFGNIPIDWLRESTRLRWLQLEAAGIEAYLSDAGAAWTQRVKTSNLRGFFGIPVAETLVSGLLALYRGLPTLARLQLDKRWALTEVRAQVKTLNGSSAIVLGCGSIGTHTRKLLEAFGTKVASFARSAVTAEIRSLAELDERLPQADLVVGCLPDTTATKGMWDAARIGKMKPGSVFANGGRGSLVDEAALLAAVENGHLAGAVLDVTAEEPLPSSHPFWRLSNIVLTQHTGGGFANEAIAKVDLFLANLERFNRGEPLVNAVDLSRQPAP